MLHNYYLLLSILAITDSPLLNSPSIRICSNNNNHYMRSTWQSQGKDNALIIVKLNNTWRETITCNNIAACNYKCRSESLVCIRNDLLFCSAYYPGRVCDTVVRIYHPAMEGKVPGTGRMWHGREGNNAPDSIVRTFLYAYSCPPLRSHNSDISIKKWITITSHSFPIMKQLLWCFNDDVITVNNLVDYMHNIDCVWNNSLK